MLKELVEKRRLPALTTMADGTPLTAEKWPERRRELVQLLSEQVFGFTPAAPAEVRCSALGAVETVYAGKGLQYHLILSFDAPNGAFSFPVELVMPRSEQPVPVFVAIAFRPGIPDRYLPMEEIIDRGYGVANIHYEDITTDNGENTGLARLYPRDEATGWGKIGMWAFAMSRVLDYLFTRTDVDHSRIAAVGHSRLGKTALWAGAQDERFSLAISNDSGCSGAAISRGKVGETVCFINDRFPYWFCGNYRAWAGREYEMLFDQHMLLALNVHHHLYVASALEDTWADPESEFLSCVAASEIWSLLGLTGLVTPDHLPAPGEALDAGRIGYHLRTGTHFLSRTDWVHFMNYRDRHGV